MSIVSVNEDNFDQEVLKSEQPVLVDFNATWCPPCKALHPTLEAIADKSTDYKVAAVDIDESAELAAKYEVSSIPCLIVFRNGEEVDREIGLKPKAKILKMLGQ